MENNLSAPVIVGLSNADYHAHSAIGSSGFKLLAQSPLHYWAAYVDPNRQKREPTPAMKIGSAWHCAVFEPGAFKDRYAVIPEGLDRRTKEGKQLWQEIQDSGLEAIASETHVQIVRMAAAAYAHPASAVLFGKCTGMAEASIFWRDEATGVDCKIRPDYMVPPCELFPNGLIVDGKSCEDASPAGFAKNAWNWEMHFQAAFYSDGFQTVFGTKEPPAFLWLAQEKSEPYATAYYSAGQDLLAYGRKEYRRLLGILAACRRDDRWPGYPTDVSPLVLPAFAAKVVQDAIGDAA